MDTLSPTGSSKPRPTLVAASPPSPQSPAWWALEKTIPRPQPLGPCGRGGPMTPPAGQYGRNAVGKSCRPVVDPGVQRGQSHSLRHSPRSLPLSQRGPLLPPAGPPRCPHPGGRRWDSPSSRPSKEEGARRKPLRLGGGSGARLEVKRRTPKLAVSCTARCHQKAVSNLPLNKVEVWFEIHFPQSRLSFWVLPPACVF